MDEIEDIGSNRSTAATIGEVISRRAALLGGLAALMAPMAAAAAVPRRGGPSSLTFPELSHQMAQEDAVAPGHAMRVLIRWGDPVLPGAPAFDASNVTAAAQAMQFGYNNDFLALLPIEPGAPLGDRALLWVNHEYTNTNLMFPASAPAGRRAPASRRPGRGGDDGPWRLHRGAGARRRRLAPGPARPPEPPHHRRDADGAARPAAGHPRLRTERDPPARACWGC
jgi:hypothetical protein